MLDIIILNKRNGIPHKVRVLGKVDGFSRQCCQPLSPLPVKKVKNAANSNFLQIKKPISHPLGSRPSTACFGPWPVLKIHPESCSLWNNAQKLNFCTTNILTKYLFGTRIRAHHKKIWQSKSGVNAQLNSRECQTAIRIISCFQDHDCATSVELY